jgi:predicted transposase/invertase (TIGR01784 family)
MQFADPKNDLAFKKIFGDENHKEILISFLNSVLDFKDEKEIVDITLTNPYQLPDIKELKETILDIKAKNMNGEEFIVEMQKKDLGDFAKRSLYYTAKAYVQQLPSGKGKKDYDKLKRVYYIAIVNFEIFDNKNYISRHLIINQETTKQDLKDFEFTFIELPKFNKELDELTSTVDKWIYFIKNANDLTMIPKEFQEEPFKQAFEIATQTVWSQKELEVYEYMALKEYDEENAIRTAERRAEKRGMQKGEKKAKIEIVKKSLNMGLDIKTVSDLTGLSIEEIENLID